MTNLILEGYDTLPLSNGWDNHGKYIAHINRTDNLVLVVGYLHKFIPVIKEYPAGEDILSSLKAYKIFVVFIIPGGKQAKAKKMLASKGVSYKLASPAGVSKTVMKILEPKRSVKKARSRKRR